ncbi:MAG: hypothetical protein KJN83_01725 [Nitrosopumilus sp.]|nr:hypothetical protein [Nitrosopumilus sp.]
MKKGISVIIVGAIIGVLGIIFHLQGHSVVGPQSSFMYSNPDWVTYGIQIAIIGLIVIGAGIIAIILKKG